MMNINHYKKVSSNNIEEKELLELTSKFTELVKNVCDERDSLQKQVEDLESELKEYRLSKNTLAQWPTYSDGTTICLGDCIEGFDGKVDSISFVLNITDDNSSTLDIDCLIRFVSMHPYKRTTGCYTYKYGEENHLVKSTSVKQLKKKIEDSYSKEEIQALLDSFNQNTEDLSYDINIANEQVDKISD